MTTVGAVLIGATVAVLGLLLMWFRVPVATFFRDAQERRGSQSVRSQTPALVFVVGAGFFVIGAVLVGGTLAGWLHRQ